MPGQFKTYTVVINLAESRRPLREGGAVFKDAQGQSKTQRIAKADIAPTVRWLESITNLDLTGENSPYDGGPSHWFGSTGRKADSGDLDLQVDGTRTTKDALVASLTKWVRTQPNTDPSDYIKKTGVSVHFLAPIKGNPKNGFVQTDFMFTNNPAWSQFIFATDPASAFKGADRFHLLNSLASEQGYKLNQTEGLMNRDSNAKVTDDPKRVATILLGQGATPADTLSVERMLRRLKSDPNVNTKIEKFIGWLESPRAVNGSTKLRQVTTLLQ